LVPRVGVKKSMVNEIEKWAFTTPTPTPAPASKISPNPNHHIIII